MMTISTRFTCLCFLFFLFSLVGIKLSAEDLTSRDFSVMISAEVVMIEGELQLKLNWKPVRNAVKYIVSSKNISESNWTKLSELTPEDLSYVDLNLESGKAKEYFVEAKCDTTNGTNPFVYGATGYIYAGLEYTSKDLHGKIILLIDSTIADPLEVEINRLIADLSYDGWQPLVHLVPRTINFDKDAVKTAKNIILTEYNADPMKVKAVMLLGRVAVPYSGNIAPDGHTDHQGAWPADVYYGCMQENLWSDAFVENSSASRAANRNLPGDGKFDPSTIPSNAVLMTGRIDFYDMPEFQKSETELLRDYLDRNHSYRTGKTEYIKRGLIDDHFPAKNFGYAEVFSSSGWRNFSVLTHPDSVRMLDWFTTLTAENYLWSYGTGAGGYTSTSGVGTTKDFAEKGTNSIFTMLFGSYFGDWDSKNNILRAVLCSPSQALTSCWSARPHWYFHHFALGEPIGFSGMQSQNNSSTYKPIIFYDFNGQKYPNGATNASLNKMVHTALMGDPALRSDMGLVSPPKFVSVSSDNNVAQISWEAPDNDGVYKYNIYRSFDEFGKYERLNAEPMSQLNFTDTLEGLANNTQKDVFYRVRTISIIKHSSGSSSIYSVPAVATAVISSIAEKGYYEANPCSLTVAPNPLGMNSNVSFTIDYDSQVSVELYDINGERIGKLFDADVSQGRYQIGLNKNVINLAQGVYFVKLTTKYEILTEKVIVTVE